MLKFLLFRNYAVYRRTIPCNSSYGFLTILVQQGIQEAIIRKKLGWTPTSPMIARYQHLDDNDVVEATLRNHGKVPQKLVITEIKQPEKVSLVDAAMQFSKLSEENQELKKEIETMKAMFNEDVIRAMIEARVNEILKKGQV